MKINLFPIATGLVLMACEVAKEATVEIGEVVENTIPQSIDLDYINSEVRPQDDFFEFANGSWIKNNPVPASESRWGSFNELDKSNKAKLTKILEDAKNSNPPEGSLNQILGDYYASFTNFDERNKLSYSPIKKKLLKIEELHSKSAIVGLLAEQHKMGISSLFNFGVGQDLKDVDHHTIYLNQGGIGLPNKDYYFEDGKAEIRTAYLEHMRSTFELADKMNPEESAENVIGFERRLAHVMMAPAELRIPEKTYNKFSRKDAMEMFGSFDFEEFLSLTGISAFDSLVIGQPQMVKNIAALMDKVELTVWKDYLYWKTINHYAGHLDEKFVQQNFAFYGTVLSGKLKMKPANERAIEEITHMEFGELLGKAFVDKHYSASAQNRVNEMVDNLLIVFKDRINQLDWMSGATKKEALNKLTSIGRKLGFPEKWEDFGALKFTTDNYLKNIDAAQKYSYEKNINKLNKKVNKDEWAMPAHMINAYYHPLLNEIAFPAGIMQAPFFDENYEEAVNYGRIGMVIGHEFTHGFDDMGSKFAADGSFKNWWSESDRDLFEERTSKLGNTFAGFCPIEGHCVNPDLTMGENIADLGGLTLAYHAYKRTSEYKSGLAKKGYSPSQRFFIAYAQLWKINYTEEELKNRIANDSHSPGMYRVNGPLMNCPEFFEAFNVVESDPMRNNAAKIAKIW